MGASSCQFAHDSSTPRGARTGRGPASALIGAARSSRSRHRPPRPTPIVGSPFRVRGPTTDQVRHPARSPAGGRGPPRWRAPASGARSSMARAAVVISMARIARRLSTTLRSLRAAAQPIDTWSSCIADVGIESTLAGTANRLFSATNAARGVLSDHQSRIDAGVVGEEGRQTLAAPARPTDGRYAARPSTRHRRARWRESRRRSRGARRGSSRSKRRGRRAAPSDCRSLSRARAGRHLRQT